MSWFHPIRETDLAPSYVLEVMGSNVDETDQHHVELLRAAGAGSEESLGALYDIFARSLYGMGLRMLGDSGRAEDMVQDTMLKVWKASASFDASKGRPSSWIFTIGRRTALDMSRKKIATPVADAGEMADRAVHDEHRDWEVGVLLSTLPEDHRLPIEMFVIEGYTQAEVADTLGVPLGTIKTRIYRGLKRLHERLDRLNVLGASR